MLQLREQAKYIEKNLPGFQALALQFNAFGDASELKVQLLEAAFDRACLADPLPRMRAEFERRRDEGRSKLTLIANELARQLGAILAEYGALQKRLQQMGKAFPEPCRDIRENVERLLPKRFVAELPFERLQHVPRYLKAASLRLDKLRADPTRDARFAAELAPLAAMWQREQMKQLKSGEHDPQMEQFRWLLEELRVQLFTQELKTPVPVSVKRLQKMWQAMQR
jgi:ATP-dependent helicase HrpA